jgi:hypothetical protein
MMRWLPLTPTRLAVLAALAGTAALGLLWVRPAAHPSADVRIWAHWARAEADWPAVLRQPQHAFVWAQPRWQPPAAIPPAIPPAPPPLAYPAIGTAAMLERPLLVPNRRPPPPPPPPEAAPPPDPLRDAALMGTLAGDKPMAIVRLEAGTRRLAVGASVGDWTLHAVEPTQVQFKRGEEARTLTLAPAPLGAPNPAARAATPTAAAPAAPAATNLPPNLQAVLERTQREMEERARARAAAGLPPLR